MAGALVVVAGAQILSRVCGLTDDVLFVEACPISSPRLTRRGPALGLGPRWLLGLVPNQP